MASQGGSVEVLPPVVRRQVLTVDEAAQALGVSVPTVYRRVREGRITTVSYTDRVLIPVAEVARLTKAGRR